MAHVKPVVVRIDTVGRAEAVTHDTATWKPQTPELRYFLSQFTQLHFNRIKATVPMDFPDSLFPRRRVAGTGPERHGGKNPVEMFAENQAADELVEVKNVTPDAALPGGGRLRPAVVRAAVAAAAPTDTFTAQVVFTYREFVPNTYMRVNPLRAPNHPVARGPGVQSNERTVTDADEVKPERRPTRSPQDRVSFDREKSPHSSHTR
jgi:hypothetical protein